MNWFQKTIKNLFSRASSLPEVQKEKREWKQILKKLRAAKRDERIAIVQHLKDQELLAYLVLNDTIEHTKYNAIGQLKDKNILEIVAKENSVYGNQARERLKELIEEDNRAAYENRMEIMNQDIHKIKSLSIINPNHQKILEQYARFSTFSEVRNLAVLKLADQTVLGEIARNEEDATIRKNIISRLPHSFKNQSLFETVALNNKEDISMREIAIQKITDQKVLEKLINSDMKEMAFAQLKVIRAKSEDEKISLSRSDTDWRVRCYSIKFINDIQALVFIVENDKDYRVTHEAMVRLGELGYTTRGKKITV